MNLTDYVPQQEIIDALAQKVRRRYPEKGACASIAKDLTKELVSRGISAKHVSGDFYLDEPGAFNFTSPTEEPDDEYVVNHDWVDVEGRIVDAAATQFKKYVYEYIPDVLIADFRHPLYTKYYPKTHVK